MITIFRARCFAPVAGLIVTWHPSGEAAWRAIEETRLEWGDLRRVSVEPVDVIVTHDGVLRLLNRYATGREPT